MEPSNAMLLLDHRLLSDTIEKRELHKLVVTCPRDTLFTSQCMSQLPVSRACFRKEIKCVDEECEFNEIPARFQQRETRKNSYLSYSSLLKFNNYFISYLFRSKMCTTINCNRYMTCRDVLRLLLMIYGRVGVVREQGSWRGWSRHTISLSFRL